MTITDHAHTHRAETNRQRKAHALAGAAVALGLQPYDLTVVGGTQAHADNRGRVRRLAGLDRDPSVETWQTALGHLFGLAAHVPAAEQCARCDAYVRPVITESGARLLVDPFAHPAGTVWPLTTPHGQRAKVLAGHDPHPQDVPLFRQHAASCPANPRAARARAPRCSVCAQPLDAVLAARDPSYTSHPRCEPREEVTIP